jgi:hypothetical protein
MNGASSLHVSLFLSLFCSFSHPDSHTCTREKHVRADCGCATQTRVEEEPGGTRRRRRVEHEDEGCRPEDLGSQKRFPQLHELALHVFPDGCQVPCKLPLRCKHRHHHGKQREEGTKQEDVPVCKEAQQQTPKVGRNDGSDRLRTMHDCEGRVPSLTMYAYERADFVDRRQARVRSALNPFGV